MVYPHHCHYCFISYRFGIVCHLEGARIELHENKVNDDGYVGIRSMKKQALSDLFKRHFIHLMITQFKRKYLYTVSNTL